MRVSGLVSVALILLVFATACGQQRVSIASWDVFGGDGIIGGQDVLASEPIANTTAFLYDVSGGSFCSASIIDSRWLLTAAHCVADHEPRGFIVSMRGTYSDLLAKRVKSSDLRRVVEIQVHPRYALAMKQVNDVIETAKREGRDLTVADLDKVRDWGDIAILKLDQAVPLGKSAARFLPETELLHVGQTVTIAGYGQTGIGETSSTGQLKKVDVQILDTIFSPSEILVDNRGKGACHGDSGGPAYVQRSAQLYLFGITSHGVGDAGTCDSSTAYTNAVKYRQWMKTYIPGL